MSTAFAQEDLLTKIVLPTGQLTDERPTYGVLERRRLMEHGITYGLKKTYGNGTAVVVVEVTIHQGDQESWSQGEGQ
jgi:hypothetical protein